MTVLKEETKFFDQTESQKIDVQRLPKHIAIIPDGNRRWAKKQQSSVKTGHREGADNLMDIIKAGREIGVKTMTFYLFSTENWNRSKEEVDALMWLLPTYLVEQKQTMIDNGIRLHTIGDLSRLPPDVLKVVNETKEATANGNEINFVMALNYGSRDEITRAVRQIALDVSQGKLQVSQIDEALIASYLDTCLWPDPDLLIRTSAEFRVSNFLLWQISYSEVHIEDVLWPEFTPRHLLQAIIDFQGRDRRLGGP
jgi:undecaprenyl diphosphate synthase